MSVPALPRISGCTFIRNGQLLDYTFIEAALSLVAVCDEVIVVVGQSRDQTREAIVALNEPKIRIIDTVWDETKRQGGVVLAEQTDIALQAATGDWILYLQGDEVYDERTIGQALVGIARHHANPQVEGLLFEYLHFYGSFHYVLPPYAMYRYEVRAVRRLPGLHSWRDAQGFRLEGRKLRVKHCGARVFHYGHARSVEAQIERNLTASRYWHDDEYLQRHRAELVNFRYDPTRPVLPFTGTHPAVMQPRLATTVNPYAPQPDKFVQPPLGKRIRRWMGLNLGWYPFEYRNYRLVR